MNIFKILASNDGSINEPNVSSFLAYLLDPNENHGLNSFLAPILLANRESFKELLIQERVRDLSKNSPFEVNVQAEITVELELEGGRTKTRDIDILIEIYNGSDAVVPRYAFCIENKIKDGAIAKGGRQLFEEISGLANYYAGANDGFSAAAMPAMAFVFITPRKSPRAVEEFGELNRELAARSWDIPSFHLTWGPEPSGEAGSVPIAAMLNKTLLEEAAGNIEPIYEYTKHTLKSFLAFIKSDFQSYKEEKTAVTERKDYGKPVSQYYREVCEQLEYDRDYRTAEIRSRVEKLVYETSGKEIRKNTLADQLTVCIVNNRNRRHYGVGDPLRDEINLLYYPSENDRKTVRRIDLNRPPVGIPIYWRDADAEGGLGQCLLTDLYPR
ncbi:PD-(D/E)XK nuclease family protein [Cohnella xylanilytica]|uniref:PD-(D/E)XK nuclease family protein n=1 Tax=Cohnella xylanilytica TaxID=557555 RepID=A0A841U3X1_9BACL|nr:PD-(D/E)XK nuclease family protein [Cohnella xylanilytica]MBB6692684.1 PD-(D/E)XK nuclease family protein [Cohnella xylanilytica]